MVIRSTLSLRAIYHTCSLARNPDVRGARRQPPAPEAFRPPAFDLTPYIRGWYGSANIIKIRLIAAAATKKTAAEAENCSFFVPLAAP